MFCENLETTRRPHNINFLNPSLDLKDYENGYSVFIEAEQSLKYHWCLSNRDVLTFLQSEYEYRTIDVHRELTDLSPLCHLTSGTNRSGFRRDRKTERSTHSFMRPLPVATRGGSWRRLSFDNRSNRLDKGRRGHRMKRIITPMEKIGSLADVRVANRKRRIFVQLVGKVSLFSYREKFWWVEKDTLNPSCTLYFSCSCFFKDN